MNALKQDIEKEARGVRRGRAPRFRHLVPRVLDQRHLHPRAQALSRGAPVSARWSLAAALRPWLVAARGGRGEDRRRGEAGGTVVCAAAVARSHDEQLATSEARPRLRCANTCARPRPRAVSPAAACAPPRPRGPPQLTPARALPYQNGPRMSLRCHIKTVGACPWTGSDSRASEPARRCAVGGRVWGRRGGRTGWHGWRLPARAR